MEAAFDNIYYVGLIIYVIYQIIKAFNKNKNKDEETPNSPSRETAFETDDKDTQRPVTFEELLKEFTQSPEPKREVIEEDPYEEIVEDEFEESSYVDEEEKSQKYIDWEKRMAQSKHSILDDSERTTKEDFGTWGVESEEPEFDMGELLSSPEDIKKAIIMKEILDRKY